VDGVGVGRGAASKSERPVTPPATSPALGPGDPPPWTAMPPHAYPNAPGPVNGRARANCPNAGVCRTLAAPVLATTRRRSDGRTRRRARGQRRSIVRAPQEQTAPASSGRIITVRTAPLIALLQFARLLHRRIIAMIR